MSIWGATLWAPRYRLCKLKCKGVSLSRGVASIGAAAGTLAHAQNHPTTPCCAPCACQAAVGRPTASVLGIAPPLRRLVCGWTEHGGAGHAHGFYMEVLCSGGLVRGGHAADISRHGAPQPMPTHPPATQALPHLRRKATYLATLTRSSSFNRAFQPCRSHSNKGPCIVSHASGVMTFTGTCGALRHPSLIRLTRARC